MKRAQGELDPNCVRPLDGGSATSLSIRAQPGAQHAGFVGFWNGHPKIAVREAPEDGRANAAIALALAKLFALRKSAVSQIGGPTSRAKTYRLECAPTLVLARLRALSANDTET